MNLLIALFYKEIKIILVQKYYALLKFLFFLTQLITFYFLCKLISKNYFQFLFYGLIFSKIFNYIITTPTEIVENEKYWGTIENFFMLPYSESGLLLITYFIKLTFLLLELILIFIVGRILLSIEITFIKFLYFFIFVIFLCIVCLGIVFLIFGFSLSVRKFEISGWLITVFVDLLSGVYFPTETLPYRLQIISKLLPTTYFLQFFRELLINGSLKLWILIYPVTLCTFIIPISIVVFNLNLKKVYLNGQLTSL